MIRGLSRFLNVETLKYIMTSCVVLHNMIIEDERGTNCFDYNYDVVEDTPVIALSHTCTSDLQDFINLQESIRDRQAHFQL